MPVKSLESFLFEKGLVGSYPIESLKNATLGIDVDHYVSRLLTSKREQYLDAIGGFPTSLKMYLESDLQVFKEYNITPVFIFSGSAVANQVEASGHYTAAAEEAAAAVNASASGSLGSSGSITRSVKETILAQRHRGWTQWNNLLANNQSTYIDQPIPPTEAFRYNVPLNTKRFQSDLIHYFISLGIYFQVAPYTSWMQLAYLLQNSYIDAIYGPTDILMLDNVEKFILGMEFPNKEFRFIDKARVLSGLKCSSEEFIDICMAVGNDLQPYTLSPLQVYPPQQLFEMALEMVVNTGTDFYAYQLVNPLNIDNTSSIARYQKGVSALKYMPVLKENGKVELFGENEASNENSKELEDGSISSPTSSSSSEIIPNDVHDVVSQRLPHEYYFYRSVGLISGKLLDAIATGVYPEEPPLDGGSSNSYRNLVRVSAEMFKNKEINLLTQPINRYYQIKPIAQVNWFSPDDPITLTNRMTPSMFDRINHLIVKTDDMDRQFSIYEFINLINKSNNLVNDFVSEKVIFPNSVPISEKLKSSFDILSTSFLRFLTLLEFFEYDHSKKILKPTKWGKILLDFNKLGIDSQFQEAIFIFMTFLKTGVLSLTDETQPSVPLALSKATIRTYPTESSYILILTRVLSLFRLKQKPANYHGPIDKKALIYLDHLDYVKENMNELFESVLISSLTAGEFDRLSLDNIGWQRKIVALMPFKLSSPSTVTSMIWEFYLQKFLHNGHSRGDAMALVMTIFNTYKSVPNLEEELERSLLYLNHFALALKEMADEGLCKPQDYDTFKNALSFATESLAK